MLTAEDLAAAAVDAATARRLEEIADAEQASEAMHEQMRALLLEQATQAVEAALGDASTTYRCEYEQRDDAPDRVIVELAGIKLEMLYRGDLQALVTCPLCDAWNCTSRDTVHDLADLGEILTHGAALVWHDTPETKKRCNGLRIEDKPEEREAWRVVSVESTFGLHEQLNAAEAEGYRPQIYPTPRGWVIVGRRIGDRFNPAYDAIDDEEPF